MAKSKTEPWNDVVYDYDEHVAKCEVCSNRKAGVLCDEGKKLFDKIEMLEKKR